MTTRIRVVNTRKPPRIPTGSPETDRALDLVVQAIDEQRQALEWVALKDVTLADTVTTRVRHGLGRMPLMRPLVSAISNAATSGRVDLMSMDENEIQLEANGYGATITVDILVL